ncbi:M20/M25/M40 family metallo-hydrolase [Geodermatophilus sp. YIM 151500]|uniref:M28 family peptidase n=1 Tax=Geodermatophilus sp. YIM 151500 TaxID=2984531 RepID=UPI0021E36474|nr:M28 family peptidase [Geodermatophilus sp. YIM 151500]MCV2488026.1 M20/M25/M40 family metallo-hydrolase [Geodermatophilus sp. YIM 151500]
MAVRRTTPRRTTPRRTTHRAVAAGSGALLLAAVLPGAAASAQPEACADRVNDSYAALLECVTVEGVREHQAEFQKIADNNTDSDYPGSRSAGTPGYTESVRYVADRLREAGYVVTLDPVEFVYNFPATLRQLAPAEADLETGVFTGSGSGEVEGPVVPVDINLTGDRASTSACEPEDFAGLDLSGPADIALVQRGTCFFGDKAQNAAEAGAEAVVVFNQGDAPDREGLIVADASSVTGVDGPVQQPIPVVGASFADGEALAQPGATAYVNVLPPEDRTDYNVVAELPGEDFDNVVVAGAHLDSVPEGPGINDNASGSAALLETAIALADLEPRNTLRFAWWAVEELGLIGSTDYVAGLPPWELERIALYLNFDMIGSPNYVQQVYDADQSTYPAPEGVPIPAGSEAIEDLFEAWYTSVGEPYDDTEFSGRSDYQAFIGAGIPSGGLFTGAEEVKTDQQVAIWGGTAGEQFDPCYHEACDGNDNVALHALDVNSDLMAFALLTYAYSTESVNGVAGVPVPGGDAELPAPAGPEGTFTAGGGGLHPSAAS